MDDKRILNAKITGWHNGEQLPHAYRAVVFTEPARPGSKLDGAPILRIEQQFRGGQWGPTPGSWYVETLLGLDGFSRGPIGDRIAIDLGQGWFATGLRAALREAVGLEG